MSLYPCLPGNNSSSSPLIPVGSQVHLSYSPSSDATTKMESKLMRRQRAPKTTQDQYESFLDFAVKNYIIVDSKRDPMENEQLVMQKWDELTVILNTSGRGPQRTTKEWQTTFSNWKNSIRHKMKCIIDGTSRTMLTELEGRALQLWDIVAYNGLPRFSTAMQNSTSQQLKEENQDDSTHSSSTFYGNIKDESQQHQNNDTAYGDEEPDEDEDEDSPLPPVPTISHAMPAQNHTPPTQNHYKRRKMESQHNLNSSTPNFYRQIAKQRNGTGRNGEELDGSILIAESIGKLAENVGNMAESIRDIAAAFTTTTQAAFELIRKQSEIIQGLIQQQ